MPVFGNGNRLKTHIGQNFLGVRLLGLVRIGQSRHDGFVIANQRPVSGINAVLAIGRRVDFDHRHTSLLKSLTNPIVPSLSFVTVNILNPTISFDARVVSKELRAAHQNFLV
jgi:hypothetical protein